MKSYQKWKVIKNEKLPKMKSYQKWKNYKKWKK